MVAFGGKCGGFVSEVGFRHEKVSCDNCVRDACCARIARCRQRPQRWYRQQRWTQLLRGLMRWDVPLSQLGSIDLQLFRAVLHEQGVFDSLVLEQYVQHLRQHFWPLDFVVLEQGVFDSVVLEQGDPLVLEQGYPLVLEQYVQHL